MDAWGVDVRVTVLVSAAICAVSQSAGAEDEAAERDDEHVHYAYYQSAGCYCVIDRVREWLAKWRADADADAAEADSVSDHGMAVEPLD